MEFARWTFDFQRMRTQILIPYGVLSLLYMLQSHFVHNHCIESGLNQIGTDGGKVWWFGRPHDLERTTSYRNHHWDDYVGSESLAGWFAQLQIRDMGQQVNRIVHLMSASSMHDFGGGGALARRVTSCICPHPPYVTSPPVPSLAPTTCHGPCQKVGGTDTCKGLKRKSQKHTEERLRWIRPS